MTQLRWWMRIVGVFYLLQFVMMAIVRAPIRASGPAGVLEQAAAGEPTARFLVDTWITFGLEVAAIGIVLLAAAQDPRRSVGLVWAVIAIEVLRGIVLDIYMLSRGYNPTVYGVWIVIHALGIATALYSLRAFRAASTALPADLSPGHLTSA